MKNATARNLDLDQEISSIDQTREILEKEYQVDTTDIKNPESLTYVILELAVNQNYERAIRELKAYFNHKKTYPTYEPLTFRIFEHIENIVRAIKAKKNLMNFPNLSAAKKKELHFAIVNHFRDLKASLQKVTQIEYQLRNQDSRSTLWVVNAFVLCTFIIVAFALLREAYDSLNGPIKMLEQDISRVLTHYLGF